MSQPPHDAFRDDPHAWTRQRLVPLETGLLDEAEEQRIRGHLDGCAECSERWNILREETPDADSGGHIPVQIMARWATASAKLQGLERAMVSRHLERCAECRADLQVLGFEPTLMAARVVADVERPRVVAFDRNRRQQRSRVWGKWGMNLWIPTAAAAALLLAVTRGPSPSQSPQSGGAIPKDGAPPVEVVVAPTPPLVLPPETKPDERRERRRHQASQSIMTLAKLGSTAGGRTLGLGAGRTRGLDEIKPEVTPMLLAGESLFIPIPDDLSFYPDDSSTQIHVIDPDGNTVGRMKNKLGQLKSAQYLKWSPGDTKLMPGEYAVRSIVTAPGADAPADTQCIKKFVFE